MSRSATVMSLFTLLIVATAAVPQAWGQASDAPPNLRFWKKVSDGVFQAPYTETDGTEVVVEYREPRQRKAGESPYKTFVSGNPGDSRPHANRALVEQYIGDNAASVVFKTTAEVAVGASSGGPVEAVLTGGPEAPAAPVVAPSKSGRVAMPNRLSAMSVMAGWKRSGSKPESYLDSPVYQIGDGDNAMIRYFPKPTDGMHFQVFVDGRGQKVKTYTEARDNFIGRLARNSSYKAFLDEFQTGGGDATFPKLDSEREIAETTKRRDSAALGYQTAVDTFEDTGTEDDRKIFESGKSYRNKRDAAQKKLDAAKAIIKNVRSCEWREEPTRLFVASCSAQVVCSGAMDCVVELESGTVPDSVAIPAGCTSDQATGECPAPVDCVKQEGLMLAGDRYYDFQGDGRALSGGRQRRSLEEAIRDEEAARSEPSAAGAGQ